MTVLVGVVVVGWAGEEDGESALELLCTFFALPLVLASGFLFLVADLGDLGVAFSSCSFEVVGLAVRGKAEHTNLFLLVCFFKTTAGG